jgi:hypothetical protein
MTPAMIAMVNGTALDEPDDSDDDTVVAVTPAAGAEASVDGAVDALADVSLSTGAGC